ncbi:hypothetical protein M405DRAFT_837351 [Rhizopogon salebrosus TDB-379]|nr:hypothetical protein M405DRAFT_837351 [Rhizopogon salebrosus TDB-379]
MTSFPLLLCLYCKIRARFGHVGDKDEAEPGGSEEPVTKKFKSQARASEVIPTRVLQGTRKKRVSFNELKTFNGQVYSANMAIWNAPLDIRRWTIWDETKEEPVLEGYV